VLPEPEPKPLFAEGNYDRSWSNSSYDTRDTGSHNTNSTGPRNGSLPAAWGPDADEPDADEPDRRWETGGWNDDAPGKTWLRLAAVIAGIIVLVVGVVFAFNLGRGSDTPAATSQHTSSGSPSSKSSSGPVPVASVTDFDPEGDGTENAELAPLAIDGNPNTAWKTLTYYGRPNLGGLKSGVGLVVDLGSTKKVSSVQLTLQGSPTSVEILGQPDSTTKPTSVDGLSKLAANAGAGTSTDLNFKQPAKLRYFVVWLTNLPSVSGGYQGAVAEIQPRS
jgi:hypothetical protein